MKINYPITSRFSQKEFFRGGKSHSGIDFDMEIGEPLRSIKDGVIYKVVDYGDLNAGKTIMVKWTDGKIAVYGHLDKFGKFKEGDIVKTGDLIGYAGNSGHVVSSCGDGSHLHFGLKEGDKFIDPYPYQDLIQKMNDPHFLASLPEPTHVAENFKIGKLFESGSFNSDLLHLFKSNFISIIVEVKSFSINLLSLIDYSMFIQYLEYFFKFFS